MKHLKLSEGVHGGSGNSGMIENILLGYCEGRTGIQAFSSVAGNSMHILSDYNIYNRKLQIPDSLLCRFRINI